MIHSRIDSSTLRDRLDASYYTPEVLENDAQLRARGATALRTLIDTDGSNYGVLPPSEDYLPLGSGVPLIRGGDLDGGTIRDPEVDAPLSFKNARGTANVGDVLLLIKGACIDSPAGVALISERHAGSVFNGSCYRVKVAPVCDAGYLVAYCQTRQLLLQKKREIANTGIAYNAEDSVLGYLVPALSLDAQRYIGDKVRQAERLRERARRLGRDLDRLLSIPSLIDALSTTEQRANRVTASDLNPRLDSKYYGSRAMAVLHAAGASSVAVAALVEEVSNGFEHRDFDDEGTPYITVTEVSGGRLVLATAPRLGAGVSIPEKARIDTRCALVVRTGSIGVAVPVFEEDTHAAISSHLIRLRFKSEEEAAVVAAFLNSEAGRVLQRKISYGAVQPQIGQDELLALPIPKSLLDSGESILSALRTEDAALRAAQRLTSAATTMVEQLIDGRLNEADLVAAQKALEASDRSADRELLKSLRQSGAPDAKPLIADIDALYALLDASEEQNA